MPAPKPRIHIALFRNDLRLHDQPLLHAAAHGARDVQLLPLYCFDPRQVDLTVLNGHEKELGPFDSARTWHFEFPRCGNFKAKFLVETVMELQKGLKGRRSDLLIRFGDPESIVPKLVGHLQQQGDADVEVFCQKEQTYEETEVEKALRKCCKVTLTDGGSTMVHPKDVPFAPSQAPEIFTHFRKQVEGLNENMVRRPLPTPTSLPPFPAAAHTFLPAHAAGSHLSAIADLSASYDARSTIPYSGGESSALNHLNSYCTDIAPGAHEAPLFTYKQTRNALTGLLGSSHLSPFLAVGALSARAAYWRVRDAEAARAGGGNESSYWLVFELLWRDYWKFLVRGPMGGNRVFKLHGLQAERSEGRDVAGRDGGRGQRKGGKPHLRQGKEHPPKNAQEWSQDREVFDAWKDGRTGVPFIDANMRELAATGYMSNRGRQNVADFLAGQLHVDWRLGAEWFEALLVDHDVCSNYGNWTYVAGVGTDPRARSFNVLKQAKDYDPRGEYVRLWCPELKDVPDEHVHHPWTWPTAKEAGKLGGYPIRPLVMRPEWGRQMKRDAGEGEKTRGNKREKVGGREKH